MTIATTAPAPPKGGPSVPKGVPYIATRARLGSIDLLRGLVMIVMVLDHTRDYVHVNGLAGDPTNVAWAGALPSQPGALPLDLDPHYDRPKESNGGNGRWPAATVPAAKAEAKKGGAAEKEPDKKEPEKK